MTDKEIKKRINDYKPNNQEMSLINSRANSIMNILTNSINKEYDLLKIRLVGSFAMKTNLKENREADVDALFDCDKTDDEIRGEILRALSENKLDYEVIRRGNNSIIKIKLDVNILSEIYYLDLKIINKYKSLINKEKLSKNAVNKYYSSKALWHVYMVNKLNIKATKSKNIIRLIKTYISSPNVKTVIINIIVAEAAMHLNKKNKKEYKELIREIHMVLLRLEKGAMVLPKDYLPINYTKFLEMHKKSKYKLIDPADPKINHLKDEKSSKLIINEIKNIVKVLLN